MRKYIVVHTKDSTNEVVVFVDQIAGIQGSRIYGNFPGNVLYVTESHNEIMLKVKAAEIL